MTEKLPDEPAVEETDREDLPENADPEDVPAVDPDESFGDEEADADEIEQELLDAMKKLRRTNKKVEEYLDGLAHEVEKPASEQAQEQKEQTEKPAGTQ